MTQTVAPNGGDTLQTLAAILQCLGYGGIGFFFWRIARALTKFEDHLESRLDAILAQGEKTQSNHLHHIQTAVDESHRSAVQTSSELLEQVREGNNKIIEAVRDSGDKIVQTLITLHKG